MFASARSKNKAQKGRLKKKQKNILIDGCSGTFLPSSSSSKSFFSKSLGNNTSRVWCPLQSTPRRVPEFSQKGRKLGFEQDCGNTSAVPILDAEVGTNPSCQVGSWRLTRVRFGNSPAFPQPSIGDSLQLPGLPLNTHFLVPKKSTRR